ncbi:hypothetical protein PIB30_049570 [Stylosanthes scabra]|uniref:MAPK kinase substrate protein n=1 Tax=Stylosanthes scabra TaxID=79078 RepID=A0ABU6RHQ5_9FABA|nr:hypothetical protein [Stylosanthes scabra]
MDMGGLQRSEVSFRRQGSSGLVWDDRFLSGELNKINKQEQEQDHNKKDDQHVLKIKTNPGYRTGKPVSPAIDPPSPKLSGCGFCGAFGKTSSGKKNNNNKNGQRSKKGQRSR